MQTFFLVEDGIGIGAISALKKRQKAFSVLGIEEMIVTVLLI